MKNKDVIKAFRKANREIEHQRNGGGQFQARQLWKDKSKYTRKMKHKKGGTDVLLPYFLEIFKY